MLRSIELFTGTGGLALGIARAGFVHDLLIDKDRHAVATLRDNRRRVREMEGWNVLCEDVALLDYEPHAGHVDLLAAGAPCQPFSLGGKHGGDQDRRNMFPQVLRAVRELRPRAILIENVRGLVRPSFRPYFDYVLRQIELPERVAREGEGWNTHSARLMGDIMHGAGEGELSYNVAHQLINVANLGVPQKRERVFVIAFRQDMGIQWERMEPTHSRDALLHAQYVEGSYWREHEMLPQMPPESRRPTIKRLEMEPRPAEYRWRTVRDALRGLPAPLEYRDHVLFPNHAGNPGARSYPGHTGSPLDEPAKTLKAGVHGVPGGENMLREPDDTVRYFTGREAARLQCFPDEYQFSGPWSEIMRQLGNAVPMKVAEVIAERIAGKLEQASSSEEAEPAAIAAAG